MLSIMHVSTWNNYYLIPTPFFFLERTFVLPSIFLLLQNLYSHSHDSGSFCSDVETQEGSFSLTLLSSWDSSGRKQGMPTYPEYSQNLLCSLYLPEFMWLQEKKKIPLGHMVQLSGEKVSVQYFSLSNPIYSFSFTLNSHLHWECTLIKPRNI